MESDQYNKLFDLAISIKNEGVSLREKERLAEAEEKFKEAILILEKLYAIDIQPDKFDKTLILGGLYRWIENFEMSYQFTLKAVNLKPDSELASLNLYLALVELNKSDLAIEELKRYLDLYPAKLYKDTLDELLDDLRDGYIPAFKKTILRLAKKNGFPNLPQV